MANPNVLFSRGSSVTFPSVLKDPNTIYFLTDTNEIYLGSDKYGFGKDITVTISGVGDTVSNVSWDLASKTLILTMGEAGDAQSIKDAIDEAVGTCIKTISTDRGSAILVDDEDPENVKLSLNIAEGQHAGNVLIEECSDGLKASVEIPEDAVQGVVAGDKVLSLEGELLKSTLSIGTVKENDITYVILKGIGGQEISRFDASDFVKDGMLDSVALEYSTEIPGHRVLVFTFNTASGKEKIKVDVTEFIDTYTAAAEGGLKLDGNEFSIKNEVEASGPINTDVAPGFGETVVLKAVKYDAHGLVTGTGNFNFTMPSIVGGEIGGSAKLLRHVQIASDGTLTGVDIDISTALNESSKHTQIPTAKAVYEAIQDAKTLWERF